MHRPEYDFLKTAGRILNSGQSRTVVLTGNIHDLFYQHHAETDAYVPLVNFLAESWQVSNKLLLVYELNGPIRFIIPNDRERVRDAWLRWRTGLDANKIAIETMLSHSKARGELEAMSKTFDANLSAAVGNPTVAMEMLRQLCICSRTEMDGRPLLYEDLIIIIEAADLLIPDGEITRLSDADRHRVSIAQDWFSDPGFMNGGDSVVLLAESRSLLHSRISTLPQVIDVNVPSPNEQERGFFIEWFDRKQPADARLQLWSSAAELARLTAGLSVHALRQMLIASCHTGQVLQSTDVVAKVEEYIQSQLGEDIVEFKKPAHSLDDVVGFTSLKTFLREELIPRFQVGDSSALPGAAVCGPIGGGKTFIFEAVARELDMVVLVLKNIRSQWFGQTDVIFERLRRVLDALTKVVIFVDEADTQFGGVGEGSHATERRLTGKIQAMMSDPKLRGRVIWLLMTARIHLLSPDIRRPGRVGDLIIPILDPTGADREEFLRWSIRKSLDADLSAEQWSSLDKVIENDSAAGFASLRSELKARTSVLGRKLSFDEMILIIQDRIPPAIGQTRHYQTLQALVNCTRRSLLPDPTVRQEERERWESEVRALEAQGIH